MDESRAKKEAELKQEVKVTLFNNEKPQEAIKGKVNNFSFAYPHGQQVKVPVYVLNFLKTLKYRKWESDGTGYIQMDSISIHYHEDGLKQKSDQSNNPVRGLLEMQPIPNTFTQEEAIGQILKGMGLEATPEAIQMFIDQLKGKAGQITEPAAPGSPVIPPQEPEFKQEMLNDPAPDKDDPAVQAEGKTRNFIEDTFLNKSEE